MSSVAEHQVVSPPTVDVEDPASTLGDCLTFVQVAAAYKVAVITVGRWASRGILLGDGSRVHLPYFWIGRMRYVRRPDLVRFLEQLNGGR